ncbi:MAG: D-Ala-D-Ala carboxypeptidase family metallohydrolase, partial [Bacteroidaceae bacterium]|nr:D-Ala-D-Ala carboxypeptidase family metallohydrolase [Bacteroidaceae bacterium]
MMPTPVTMHFTIEELCASETAIAKGISNKPNMQQMINLVYLAAYVLEPLRVAMKEPIKIGSGFRSPALNKA